MTSSSPARVSAVDCTRVPARAAGDVAPAWGAMTMLATPPMRAVSRQLRLLSSPYPRGETTGQPPDEMKGCLRNASSPPAIS